MDKPRTLPPLVRGKVTAVLNFFLDGIRLFKNILPLSDKFNLVLQVQWWGETLPAFIRPKEFQLGDEFITNSPSIDLYYHQAKYEIKTTLDLFKSYLETCEVVELSVLKTTEHYTIGSAFLRDLSNLLNKNNEIIILPVFDYSGEEVGEIIFHTNFLEVPKQISNEINQGHKNKQSQREDYRTSSKLKADYFSLAEKTLFYDGKSRKKFVGNEFKTEVASPIKSDSKETEKITRLDLSSSISEISTTNPACVSLPEVKLLKDSSKILDFGSFSERATITKNLNVKAPSKYNSNAIKCKSKVKNESFSTGKIISANKGGSWCKNLPKPEYEMVRSTDLRRIPPKESSSKVLDYLLGSDMNKTDEESALNDFKKMSPSHNLVDSISRLCLFSNGNKTTSSKSSMYLKQPHVNFDLNNPIERNYYEKFFLNSNSDFEVAEFLNKPGQSITLGKFKLGENAANSCSVFSLDEKESHENYSTNESLDKRRTGCARCKYYKKLDELDTIIESLKHFEEKILSQEKGLESVYNENPEVSVNRKEATKDQWDNEKE